MEPEGGDAAQASNPTTPSGAPEAPPAIVSLPQPEFDRLLGQRVAEAGRASTKKALAELGVNSLDEAKALIAAQKVADDANRTETERAIARASERETAAAAREAAAAAKEHTLNVAGALMAAGAKGDLAKLARLVDVEAGAEPTAVAAAVEAAKADFPSLFGVQAAPFAPSEPTGGGAPSRPAHSPDARTRGEERAKALNPPEKRSFLP